MAPVTRCPPGAQHCPGPFSYVLYHRPLKRPRQGRNVANVVPGGAGGPGHPAAQHHARSLAESPRLMLVRLLPPGGEFFQPVGVPASTCHPRTEPPLPCPFAESTRGLGLSWGLLGSRSSIWRLVGGRHRRGRAKRAAVLGQPRQREPGPPGCPPVRAGGLPRVCPPPPHAQHHENGRQ